MPGYDIYKYPLTKKQMDFERDYSGHYKNSNYGNKRRSSLSNNTTTMMSKSKSKGGLGGRATPVGRYGDLSKYC